MKVLLQGGLGNQMFQYAFARALAERGYDVALDAAYHYTKLPDIRAIIAKSHKPSHPCANGGGGGNALSTKALKASISSISSANPTSSLPESSLHSSPESSPLSSTTSESTPLDSSPHTRNLELAKLQICLPILHHGCDSLREYCSLVSHKACQKLLPRSRAKLFYSLIHTIDSPKLAQHFRSSKDSKRRVFHRYKYFEGFFGDLCYFAEIESILRKEFTPRHMAQPTKALQDRIKRTSDSVFLHIRRGDYLRQENWQYVKAGAAYYNGALRLITARLRSPVVFVFSDDLAWCRGNLLSLLDSRLCERVEFVFIGNGDEGNALDDLALMSSCEHAIIANSTFSFWGAYLIANRDKIICVPSAYVWSGGIPKCYPDSWHRLDVHWGQRV